MSTLISLNRQGKIDGNLDLSNAYLIQNAKDPLSSTDLSNKNYVDSQINSAKTYADGLVQGLKTKDPVAVCSIGSNISISSAPASIDGITLVSGDRVLIKDQTTASENGIYVFNGSGSTMTRSLDANSWTELINAYVFVDGGATHQLESWRCSITAGGTLGTTAVTFVKFSKAGDYTAGNGLSLVGTTFSASAGDSTISVAANGIKVGTIGSGNLGSNSVLSASISASQVLDSHISSVSASKVSGALALANIPVLDSTKIGANSILSASISANQILTASISANQVTDVKIASVSASKITGSITSGQIGANAILSASISASQISDSHIVNVSASKITGSITSGQIGAGQVLDAAINSVSASKVSGLLALANIPVLDSTKIGANSILSASISANQVTTAILASNAVTTAKITDLNVTAMKLGTDVAGIGLVRHASTSALDVYITSLSAVGITSNLQMSGKDLSLSYSSDFELLGGELSLNMGDFSSNHFMVGAVPSGTKDGVNTTFTLAWSPESKIKLYFNGQRLTENVEYSISGTTITMIAPFIPISTDTIICDYLYQG